jgi:alkanesulfonate monooxygenase SsuD/methylene tetrahydromethanopterin reductase-like flavin-dependent oxidoreductase (luciferase family)
VVDADQVAAARKGVEQRIELDPGQAEDHPDAVRVQCLYEQVGARGRSIEYHRTIVWAGRDERLTDVLETRPTISFGIFDWLDGGGGDLADRYEQRLRLVEQADRLPFRCYHLAEHHGTPLGFAPSPNVFLAAAAVRTRRIRLGPLVNVLPLYDPVRLVEEVCMLDHLCRGRLELGLGRGGSPGELALFGVRPEETRDIFREGLELLLGGLRHGRFDHEGRYFTRTGVSTPLRPRQHPYPPLWYPTSFPDSVPWIAREGMHLVFGFLLEKQGVDAREQLERYRRELDAHRGEPGRLNGHVAEPLYGNIRHVLVADSDAEAAALARPALKRFFDRFNYVWLTQQGREYYPSDVDSFIGRGHLLLGSPATVREKVSRALEELGGNYFVGVFAFGDLPPEAAQRSLDLFGREVVPAFLRPGPERREAPRLMS